MRVARVSALAGGLLILVLLLGFFLRTHLFAPSHVVAPVAPMLTRQNGSIVVRDGSPLQKRLVITPVVSADDTTALVLPAQVVPIPDHQVNVLAPATGRIMSVAVQLGQHVSRGQVLATLADSHLDQAWADGLRARAARDLAKRASYRARGGPAVTGDSGQGLDTRPDVLPICEANRRQVA